jgi:hypothetical protein
MVTPVAPVSSNPNARSKKPKKPTRKPAKEPAKTAPAPAASSSSDAEDEQIAHEEPESPDPTLAYVPPAGCVLADFDFDVEFGEFDYDAVKADEGIELWLVRAPTAVRPVTLPSLLLGCFTL